MPPARAVSASYFNIGRRLFRVIEWPFSAFGGKMTATPFALPEAVLTAISNGKPVIQACREHLGYSTEDVAVTSGLTVEEVGLIESGHCFDKGYRDRIARALGLAESIFDEISGIPNAA
ncbi:transcriptional regulator [Mesorhizobium sp. LjNodule214]|uniref:transcriptional regulator n=1 Tax=Mesorhizobium sp. LjNodule214 TaxID=3342252 RepID=UPI003ECD4FAC